MKEFLANYGFWIYLGLTVLNYVFMYFRTKKTKLSSVFDFLNVAIEKTLNVFKDRKKDDDENQDVNYIKTELFDNLSREQIGCVIDYLCDKLQNFNKECDK